jgi:(2Fe-2S) ferredoxin
MDVLPDGCAQDDRQGAVTRFPLHVWNPDRAFPCLHRCGIVPVVTSRIDGRLYAVVNVNTFEGVEPSLLRHASTTLEDENAETRLARRKCNWIADVAFIETDA